MAASFTLPTVLANLAAGNQALSLIDGDLTTLRDPLLSLNTFSNFYTDTGAANAYVITVTTPQAVTQSAGLRVQFLATSANTGASTLQINALAVKNIKNLNGSALLAGQIPANAIVDVMYDGTQYLLLNAAFPATGINKSFTSSQQTITAAGALTLAHSLGVTPTSLQAILHNTTGELGYSIGDEVFVNVGMHDFSNSRGLSVVRDATNLNVRFGSAAATLAVLHKTTGVANAITNASWTIIFLAFA